MTRELAVGLPSGAIMRVDNIPPFIDRGSLEFESRDIARRKWWIDW